MGEIAKCPVCGESPNLLMLHDNEKIITYACCGYTSVELDRWNKYASAMSLAMVWDGKRSVSYEVEKSVGDAVKKMLDAFKQGG